MTRHEEIRLMPYSPEQMFAMVKDIEKYPEFLPWCNAARFREQRFEGKIEIVEADLVIGFKAFRERFGSSVRIDQDNMRIDVDYIDGPFKVLKNNWKFFSNDSGTEVHFFVEFEFKSKVLEKVIGAVFDHAMRQIIHAFENRAKILYA